MRTLILTGAVAVSTMLSMPLAAQTINKSKVPVAVTNALMNKYPAAAKVTWEKEHGNYEANWGGKSGEDMSVQFSPAGDFVEQVQAIPLSALPAGVAQYVRTHYKGAKISEAGKVTDAKGITKYEAEIKGKDMIFDEKGNFIRVDAE